MTFIPTLDTEGKQRPRVSRTLDADGAHILGSLVEKQLTTREYYALTLKRAGAAQKFFVVRREGRGFELRSFAQKGCMHFSGSGVTTDGRPQVYVGECNNDMKKLIVAE